MELVSRSSPGPFPHKGHYFVAGGHVRTAGISSHLPRISCNAKGLPVHANGPRHIFPGDAFGRSDDPRGVPDAKIER